jgi:hypothetical protein
VTTRVSCKKTALSGKSNMNSKWLFLTVKAVAIAGLLAISGFAQSLDHKKVNAPGQLDTPEMRVALAAREDASYQGDGLVGRPGRPVQVRATGEEHRNLCYLTSIDEDAGDNEVNIVREIMDRLRNRLPNEAKVFAAYGFKRACLIVATTDGTQIAGGGVAFVFRVTPEGLTEITKQYLGQHGSPTEAVEALMKGETKKSQ